MFLNRLCLPLFAGFCLALTLACGGVTSSDTSSSSSGDLDSSFGSSGVVTTSINGSTDVIEALAIQSDGKIVVAGYSTLSGVRRMAVARYTSAGKLDTSFSSDGIATSTAGSSSASEACALGIQSDGKIVVAGYTYISGTKEVAVLRFDTDGSLDTDFSTDGIATEAIGTESAARSLVIDGSGNIIVGGYGRTSSSSAPTFALAAFSDDGSIDTSFGSSGVITTAIGSTDDEINALGLQSDGYIVAAGSSSTGSSGHRNFALARYTSTGSLDSDFSGDGKLTVSGTYDNYATSLVILSDDTAVAGGTVYDGTSDRFALARFNSTGGTSWAVTEDFYSTTTDIANGLALQSDGNLVAGGVSGSLCAFTRYTSSGSLDTSFATSGLLTGSVGSSASAVNVINAIAVQSDGMILGAGSYYDGSTTKFALVRIYP